MRKLIVVVLLVAGSQQVLADQCEEIVDLVAAGVAAASFGAGPGGSALERVGTGIGSYAAYELTNRTGTQLICDNSTAIDMWMHDAGLALLCQHGDLASCGEMQLIAISFARDFEVCGACTVEEVMGAFLMEDSEREGYFQMIRDLRRGPWGSSVPVIPRNSLALDASFLTAYYQGVSEGFQLSFSEAFGSF
jgi:hypothetical protein